MSIRKRLGYHLVKLLNCSNKVANQYCMQGLVLVNQSIFYDSKTEIENKDEIIWKNEIIRKKTDYLYVAFHKPFGFECTNNRKIKDNIYEILPKEYQNLFTLGRLDKNSEGILILTNDGKIYNKMVALESNTSKEYIVDTNFEISKSLELAFTNPFLLGNRLTLPSQFQKISKFQFKVTLKEGMNRQIRRICAKNDNQVAKLLRIKFGNIALEELKSGECKILNKNLFN